MNRGVAYGLAAYLIWGVLPLFWKLLDDVSALEIVAYRIVFSFLILGAALLLAKRFKAVASTLRDPRAALPFAVTGALLMTNWLVYIWAVNSGKVVETSLGYFMNPLVNVLLGVVFLRERMRAWQWTATALASLGVIWLTIRYGALPWIALTVAFSFGFYGLLKKLSRLDALEGLSVEMGILMWPMIALLVLGTPRGGGLGALTDNWMFLLLASTGVFTVVPLLLFGSAARTIPLTVLGLIQYVAPTMQFLLGVAVFREPFSWESLVGFSLIWIALLVFTWEGFMHKSRLGHTLRNAQGTKTAAVG